MKRTISILLSLCLLLSCAVFFTGCSAENSKDWPAVIGDVTIDKEPQNIVVLNDCMADIISYIGYDIKMVGRSDECDQEFLHVVPAVGPAASPDTNAIAAAETDLVIADNTLSASAKTAIEETGAKVLILNLPTTDEALLELYTQLGTALGGNTTGKEKGKGGYTDLLEMLSNMNTATSDVVQTVAYLYLDGNNQLCTFVKGTLEFKFFNYNGNANVFANQTEPAVNAQELRIGSPNYIFYDSEEVLAYLAADEQFANLHALVNNRTCLIPKKAFSRYGSSAEQAVFDMLNFIEKDQKATPDEAANTAPAADAPATDAPAADASTTEAPAAADTATAAAAEAPTEAAPQDENVISFSVQSE